MEGAMRILVRDKRQITLPAEICDALGIKPGDSLDLEVEDGTLIARPGRKAALDALTELRRAIAQSGVSEKEMLDGLRDIRKELFREKYPDLAAKHGI
jgi:AbrB family looped-hinge helix DNA binding protein